MLRAEDEQAPRAPAPSLANLATLADDAGARTVVEGEPRDLPAELDRAAYRIAQEALTNVRRHAGTAATATVTIGYRPDGLTVRVEDDGSGFDQEKEEEVAAHLGLQGMRERAEILGGRCEIRSSPGAGTTVDVWVPHQAP